MLRMLRATGSSVLGAAVLVLAQTREPTSAMPRRDTPPPGVVPPAQRPRNDAPARAWSCPIVRWTGHREGGQAARAGGRRGATSRRVGGAAAPLGEAVAWRSPPQPPRRRPRPSAWSRVRHAGDARLSSSGLTPPTSRRGSSPDFATAQSNAWSAVWPEVNDAEFQASFEAEQTRALQCAHDDPLQPHLRMPLAALQAAPSHVGYGPRRLRRARMARRASGEADAAAYRRLAIT